MQIKITLVQLKDGSAYVLRGAPEDVDNLFAHGCTQAGGGEVLCSAEANPRSMAEEVPLWMRIISQSERVGKKAMAEDKWEIWTREAANIWALNAPHHRGICIFPEKDNDMFLQIPGNQKD